LRDSAQLSIVFVCFVGFVAFKVLWCRRDDNA